MPTAKSEVKVVEWLLLVSIIKIITNVKELSNIKYILRLINHALDCHEIDIEGISFHNLGANSHQNHRLRKATIAEFWLFSDS